MDFSDTDFFDLTACKSDFFLYDVDTDLSMEVLFSDSIASYEAWLMFIALLVFIGIFFFDGINFVKRILLLLAPAKKTALNELPIEWTPIEIESPMLETITKAEIRAHEKEKEKEAAEIEAIQEEANTIEAEVLEQIEEHGVDTLRVESREDIETSIERPPYVEEAPIEHEMQTQEFAEVHEAEALKKWEESEIIHEPSEEQEHSHTTPEELQVTEAIIEKTGNTSEVEPLIEEEIPSATQHHRSDPHIEELYTLTSEVKTLIARGNTIDARALIIQGLALDKDHRELNLILGSLYESERQYTKAEYVYKDLALIYENDIEILEKLANILIVEKRYELAMEIYKKIVWLAWETEGSLYIMAHLAQEIAHHDELLQYTKRYQKSWPNNPEILSLMARAEIELGLRQDAIQTLIKLKNLTPYNAEVIDMINKLSMEEEMAGNFGN